MSARKSDPAIVPNSRRALFTSDPDHAAPRRSACRMLVDNPRCPTGVDNLGLGRVLACDEHSRAQAVVALRPSRSVHLKGESACTERRPAEDRGDRTIDGTHGHPRALLSRSKPPGEEIPGGGGLRREDGPTYSPGIGTAPSAMSTHPQENRRRAPRPQTIPEHHPPAGLLAWRDTHLNRTTCSPGGGRPVLFGSGSNQADRGTASCSRCHDDKRSSISLYL